MPICGSIGLRYWWCPFLILLALPGLFIVELEEFLVERFKRRPRQVLNA
ncbi:hypothetical protein ACFLX6_01045 [Chloroflexota bacterium]